MADRYPLIVDSSSTSIKELPAGDALVFADNDKIKIGTGGDLTLYHDATNSYITNGTGALKVATETSGIAVTIGHTTSETTVADNLTVTGNMSIGGNFDVTGTIDFSDSAITNAGDIQLDSITGDADTNTAITFSGSDVITISTGGAGRVTIGDGAISPVTDSQIDLGTSVLEFKDAFFDGTVTSDAFAGPLTGDVTGNTSGTSATVTGATQAAITTVANVVTVGTIGTGVWQGTPVATAYIAADAIDGTRLADNAIDSEHYTDGSIDLAHMSVNSIDSDQYVDGSIDLAHMSVNSVDSDQYVDGSIDTAHIAASQITNALMADDAIDSAEIADGAVDLAHMSANSIDSSQYVDGSIDTIHIADDQVTAAKLANTAVTAASYGSSTAIPVVTVDAQGRVTAASTAAISSDLTVGADSGSDDVVRVGTDTLDFVGTANEIETTVSDNQIQIGLPNNVTIAGNLTVSGDTTTVNTATLAVEDPLVSLATGNNAADAVDIGIYGLYDTSGSLDLYGGLFRDASDSGKWKLFKDNQAVPTTTVNVSGTGYATGTLVANLEGNVTGNVTGNTSGTAATVTGGTQAAITSAANLATVGTITTGVWSGTALVSAKIGNDQIDSQHYAAASIDNEHLADDAVDSDEIAAGAIDLAHMSVNSIDSDQYVDGSIDLAHMSANSIDSDQYVDGSIDLAHMSANSVGSTQYVDGSIGYEHIGNNQITNVNMADDAIDSAEIADGAIDLAHMSANSIDSDQYVDGSIDAVHLAPAQTNITSVGTLTSLAVGYLSINNGTIVSANSNGNIDLTPNGTGDVNLNKDTNITGTLSVTGETTLSTHLNMGDDDIIKLGASADLQIQHDGDHSIIADSGTGNLYLRTNSLNVVNAAGNETMMTAVEDGAVTLYHNNTAKLATGTGDLAFTIGNTSTDTTVNMSRASGGAATYQVMALNTILTLGSTSGSTTTATHIRGGSSTSGSGLCVLADGKVGIGTASPSARLHIDGMAAGETAFYIEEHRNDGISGHSALNFIDITDSVAPFAGLRIDHAGTGSALAVVDGKVSIGVLATDYKMQINGSTTTMNNGAGACLFINTTDNTTSMVQLGCAADPNAAGIGYHRGNSRLWMTAGGGSENASSSAFVLEGGGNVGIGTNTPSQKLDVNGTVELNNLTVAGSQGSDGQVLTSTGSGVAWEAVSGGGGGSGPTSLEENNSIYVGHDPSSTTSTAEYNTALGKAALGVITTGDYNTAIGYDACGDNQTLTHLTAVGYQAMRHITSGNDAVAVGSNCLSSASNTVGNGNTAMGYHTFHGVTTGGDGLTGFGRQAGNSQTTESQSVFIGKSAGWGANTGQSVGIGRRALQGVTSGAANTAVGFQTMYSGPSTGHSNTYVGAYCGNTTSGSNNFGLGYQAAYSGSPGGQPAGDNEGYLGDENITTINAQVGITAASDKRDKNDIEPLTLGLEFINKLEPVTYRWDKRVKYIKKYQLDLEPNEDGYVDLDDVEHDGTHTEPQLNAGLLAQDVEEIEQSYGFDKKDLTALVTTLSGDGKAYSLQYERFVPMLIKSVQELSSQVENLKEEIEELKND